MKASLLANADALTASSMAAYAAAELRFAGFYDEPARIHETAGECVGPLLRAAATALELSGTMGQERCAALHDIITDYIEVPARPQPARLSL